MSSLEDVEVVILRRYEAAHKAGDEAEMTRLRTALEVFREAVSTVREWALLSEAAVSGTDRAEQ